jgi:hypothetical protein
MALLACGCGVDRLDADTASLKLMFELDSDGGGSGGDVARDELGLFRLDLVGIYALVTVDADDMDEVRREWPEVPPSSVSGVATMDVLVPAGTDRTIEVTLLVLDEAGDARLYTGSRTLSELPGGQEIDVLMHLEAGETTEVEETVALEPGTAGVVAVHPVDRALMVVLPEAEFVREGDALAVSAGPVPAGRPLTWVVKLASGELVLSSTETEVP